MMDLISCILVAELSVILAVRLPAKPPAKPCITGPGTVMKRCPCLAFPALEPFTGRRDGLRAWRPLPSLLREVRAGLCPLVIGGFIWAESRWGVPHFAATWEIVSKGHVLHVILCPHQ